jgi:hypothetical protein
MADTKQRQAARCNVTDAQRAARRKRTIARMPKSTRRERGRQAARGRRRGAKRGTGSRTGTANEVVRFSAISGTNPTTVTGSAMIPRVTRD